MKIENKCKIIKSDSMSGRFGNPVEFGEVIFGYPMPLPNSTISGIYQRRHCKDGIFVIREKFFFPPNKQTEKNLISQGKFRDAHTAWKALTDQEKFAFNHIRKKPGQNGKNLFVSRYLKSH